MKLTQTKIGVSIVLGVLLALVAVCQIASAQEPFTLEEVSVQIDRYFDGEIDLETVSCYIDAYFGADVLPCEEGEATPTPTPTATSVPTSGGSGSGGDPRRPVTTPSPTATPTPVASPTPNPRIGRECGITRHAFHYTHPDATEHVHPLVYNMYVVCALPESEHPH